MTLNRYWTAEQLSRELAEKHGICLDAERIVELARIGHLPHATCGQDEPIYFSKATIKNWIAAHLIRERDARPYPKEIMVLDVSEFRLRRGLPAELAAMRGQLCEVPIALFRDSAIYFLVKENRVVYVGKSDNLLGRLGKHITDKDFEHVFFLPVPRDDLSDLEIAFIRALRPPLNFNADSFSPRRDAEYADLLARYGGTTDLGNGDGDANHATPPAPALGQARELLPDGCPGAGQVLPGDRAG